ncbi:MAG: alpha/beta hydrolase, partial [Bacillota bacterium]
QSTARDWLRATYDNYLQLRDSYQRVQIVGLAMGGLLGLLTAARFKVEKLVLIAAALYVKNWLVPFTHILKYIKPAIPRDEDSIPASPEAENEHEIFHNQEYYTHNYTAQVAELHKLMRLTRSRLTRVTSPTLILASKEDDTVPLKAAYRIKSKISADQIQLHIFEESPHVINNGPEKEECAARVIDFLDSA